jgi:hypothetical protein
MTSLGFACFAQLLPVSVNLDVGPKHVFGVKQAFRDLSVAETWEAL